MSGLEDRLGAAGLLPEEARRKRELFAQAEAALAALPSDRPSAPVGRWFVPGRLEVLGKHTDYAGGRCLLGAVGRGICAVAAPRSDAVLRIADAGRGLSAEVPLSPAPEEGGAGGWTRHARAVAARLAGDFPGLPGADVAIASDLPRGAGLSSSSALAVALLEAVAGAQGLRERPEAHARFGTPEALVTYIGSTEGGEDAAAILCSRSGEIAQWAFRPLRHERSMRLDDDWRFVVASSGVAADETGSRRLVESAGAIVALWNRSTGRGDETLFSVLANGPDVPERLRRLIRSVAVPGFEAASLAARLDQFLEEALVLVPAAGDLLERGEVGMLGEAVDRSQELAERLLDNQVPETSFLARSARRLGALAASSFGGGFGGSVWALVRTDEADGFRRRWAEAYAAEFSGAAADSRFFTTRPGPAVVRL